MKVFLESEEYGYEEFNAVDIEQAIEIINNLYKEAKREFDKDGIERKVGLFIAQK